MQTSQSKKAFFCQLPFLLGSTHPRPEAPEISFYPPNDVCEDHKQRLKTNKLGMYQAIYISLDVRVVPKAAHTYKLFASDKTHTVTGTKQLVQSAEDA